MGLPNQTFSTTEIGSEDLGLSPRCKMTSNSAAKNQIGKETTVFLWDWDNRKTNKQHTETKWIEKSSDCTSRDSPKSMK